MEPQIINGKFTQCWINLLTPERAAELNRAYDQQLREERRRIDAKFANRRSASPERRSHVQIPAARRTSVQVSSDEFLREQHRRKIMLHLALGD